MWRCDIFDQFHSAVFKQVNEGDCDNYGTRITFVSNNRNNNISLLIETGSVITSTVSIIQIFGFGHGLLIILT